MPIFSRRPVFVDADSRQRRVGRRVDGRRDGDDLARERAVRVRVRRRRPRSGPRGRGRGAPPARWRPHLDVSRFATSTSGWAAVPSTCSPTLTSRFTTCPAIGDVTWVRDSCRSAVSSAAWAFSTPASAAARCARASSTSLPAAMPRLNSRSVRSRLSRAFSSAAFACATRGRGLPLLVFERPRIDLGHDLPGPHRVALGDRAALPRGRHQRGDPDVLVRQRRDRAAHDQRLDEVPPRHRADLGGDRRHVGGRDLLVARGRLQARTASAERNRPAARSHSPSRMRPYWIGPPRCPPGPRRPPEAPAAPPGTRSSRPSGCAAPRAPRGSDSRPSR